MKTKYFFIFAVVLILLFLNSSFNFVNSEEIPSTGSKILHEYHDFVLLGNSSLYSGVSFSETEDYLKVSFLTPGDLPYFLQDFSNVASALESNHKTYIKIDKSSELIFEAYFTERIGTSYVFGNNNFYVPKDSTVKFSNGVIKLEVKEGSVFNSLPSFVDSSLSGNSLEIEGQEIRLSDDFILVDGKVTLNPDGWIVEEGYVDYKNNFIGVRNDNEKILIANKDVKDYSGNYLRQTDKSLEIKSSENGKVNVIFSEDHEIFNTDKKDRLYLSLEKGDSILVSTRKDQGLIPSFEHKSSENGKTFLKNNGISFKFEDGKYFVDGINPPKTKEDFENKYQSVAMEIFPNSNTQDNEKIRINSYRQFKIMNKNNNDLVSYNKYELPVSALIKDNELQTIEQLREKYPNIKFNVPAGGNFNEENAPPYLFYLTDNFMNNSYDKNFPISNFEFVTWDNAAATKVNSLKIGEGVVDHYFEIVPRDQSPLTIFEHEYEHVKDNLISIEELEKIQEKYGESSEKMIALFNEREKLLIEKNNLDSQLSQAQGDSMKGIVLEDKYEEASERLKIIEEKIKQEYFYSQGSGTLQQTYNGLVTFAYEDFYENKQSRKMLEDFSKDLQKDIHVELKGVLKKHPDISVENPESISNTFEALEKNAIDLNKEDIALIVNLKGMYESSLLYSNVESTDEEKITEFEKAISSTKSSLIFNKEFLEKDYSVKSEIGEKYYSQFEKIFQEGTGLPYLYSAYNYDSQKSLDILESKYYEASSTLREMPEEKIIQKINSPVSQVRKTTKNLVQIAFDSGKMDVEKYKRLMGENHCEKSDCCDKKCLLYTLLCEGSC